MKKIFIILVLFLLVGCTDKTKMKNCNIKLQNNDDGYTLKADYKIYYDKNEFVTKIEEFIIYKSSEESILNYYYDSKNVEYQKLYNYGGLEYSVEKIDDEVKINSTRVLKNANIKQMIKDKIINKDYTSANKLTLYGIKAYYESKGAVCDIE